VHGAKVLIEEQDGDEYTLIAMAIIILEVIHSAPLLNLQFEDTLSF